MLRKNFWDIESKYTFCLVLFPIKLRVLYRLSQLGIPNMSKFFSSALEVWKRICTQVDNSVVFIDNACAECLHWSGGPDILFQSGVIDIKDFSSFESAGEKQTKGTFILSTPLIKETARTIKDIVKSSNFKHVVIVTAVSEKLQQYSLGTETQESFFQVFEETLLKWMSNTHASSKVLYLPLFIAPLTSNFFVTPTYNDLFPIQEKDLNNLELQKGEKAPPDLSGLHFYMLPLKYKVIMHMLASSFKEFFDSMSCKPDIFALGSTSRLFSVQLSNLANQQRRTTQGQIGVLFVDRTLDLIAPSSHADKSLLDILIGILPSIQGHHNNISIDMRKLCDAFTEDDDENIFPGCLMPADVANKNNIPISDLVNLPASSALKRVEESLFIAIEEECLNEDVNVDELELSEKYEQLACIFKSNHGAILYNSSILQLSLAISQAFADQEYENWLSLAAKEKLMLQNVSDGHVSSVLSVVTGLLNDKENVVPMEDVFTLLVYALSGLGLRIENETDLSDLSYAISLLLAETPQDDLPDFILNCLNTQNEDQLHEQIERILRDACSKKHITLQHFQTIKCDEMEPPSYQPLLAQIVKHILDPSKPELKSDIEYISTGRKDLLNMGMSMFRRKSTPQPSDHDMLLIYVIGGITATEVGQVNRWIRMSGIKDCQIVLGSNKLISPSDIAERVLFSNNLLPESISL